MSIARRRQQAGAKPHVRSSLRRAPERRGSLRRLGLVGERAEGDGRDSLFELMALADPLTPEEGEPTKPLAPLDREVLSQAMDWLKAYIVSYSGDGLPSGGRAPSYGDRDVH
jgi:hypothetical protein